MGILEEIAEERVKPRPGRRHKRCVKRPRSRYPGLPRSGCRVLPPCIGIQVLK